MDKVSQVITLFNLVLELIKDSQSLLVASHIETMFKQFIELIEPDKVNVYVADWQKAKQEAEDAERKKFGIVSD